MFDEGGNVQIKSDKAGTFLVKLQTHSTFWQKLQEEFVRNELLWETSPEKRPLAKANIKEIFDSLLKLLMIFDEDLIERLLNENFFSTFQSICQFVLNESPNKFPLPEKFEDFQKKEEEFCGPLFVEITEAPFREKIFKMKYLYKNFLCKILPETKNETLTVFIYFFFN